MTSSLLLIFTSLALSVLWLKLNYKLGAVYFKKALLMKEALALKIETAAAQEREAKADPEYEALIRGLAAAVEQEETLKWHILAAEMRVEVWRSQEATNRRIDRATE